MEVTSGPSKKSVECYDILFTTGMILPLTIDLKAGDTIEFKEDSIKIYLAPKPSVTDPDTMLPAEDQLMFIRHVACIQHRTQEVLEQTPEQKKEWSKLFASQTVQ